MASTTDFTASLITKRIMELLQEYVHWRNGSVLFATLSQDILDELEILYHGRVWDPQL